MTYTDNLESAPIWRKWSAISLIGAVLERKVYLDTGGYLYPNLYCFLVGGPGLGKTRPIIVAKNILKEMPDHTRIAPTSVTMASLVDCMAEAKRSIKQLPHSMIEYNSLYIMADELSAFMHEYSGELVAGLTTFWDCVAYSQSRRIKNINIQIEAPQLSVLCGTTPSNLVKFVPEGAWEQGFMSRVILIYSEDRPIIDVFNTPPKAKPVNLIHDLRVINALTGKFGWSKEYAQYMHKWKKSGYLPLPTHPKLLHYNSRRFAQAMKLAMISSADRGDSLWLEMVDFNRSMDWLHEAESLMPVIFKSGPGGADSRAMDEILYFVKQHPEGIEEHRIMNFARQHVEYANNMDAILKIMESSGMIYPAAYNADDLTKIWKARILN